MKKIMKKALSLMLVLAMLVMPMTAMAAVGDTTTVKAETTVELPNNYTAENIEYTAETFGKIKVNILKATPDYDLWVDSAQVQNGTDSGSYEYDVKPGKTTYIQLYGYNGATEITYSVTFTETVAPALGSSANPVQLTSASQKITVPANSTYICEYSPEKAGDYNVKVTGNGDFIVVENLPPYMGGGTQEVSSQDKTYATAVNCSPYYQPTLTIKNAASTDITLTILMERVEGTWSTPATLVMGTNVANNPDGDTYYYEWIAEESGKLTIKINTEKADKGWWFDGYVMNPNTYVGAGFGEQPFRSDANPVVSEVEVDVPAGFVVNLQVSTLPVDNNGYETPVAGTVEFTASFEAGSAGDGSQGDGSQGGGSIITPEEEKNYIFSDTKLDLDANYNLNVDMTYEWTLYEFTPEETGVYTFETNNGVIGYWGGTVHYVAEPSEDDLTEKMSKPVSSVGQSVIVGVKNVEGAYNTITVTRTGDATLKETEYKIYKNETKPTTFTYGGDVDKLMETYVETSDEVVDNAVLGKDGYYHLNSADGEVLYVNLNDSLMSLVDIVCHGKLAAISYDKDGKVTEAIDFTNAILEYLGTNNLDELEKLGDSPVIYPLTKDLMTMLQKVGEANDWYGANGFIKDTSEADGWMFACYYVKGANKINSATTSPNTGDSANVAVWAIVMVVAAGAAFVVAESKRRAR